jgi:DNA invertase Pin-like site-specific DNA recombinase
MKIGYGRVSTLDQNLDLQIDALKETGCEKIFIEKASGAKDDRIELNNLMEFAREGDSIVVWKLDRLARSLKKCVEVANELKGRGIHLVSLTDEINTNTPNGKFYFHILAALNEFNRDLIIERTTAGLKAARARGRLGGRPKKLSLEEIKKLQYLHNNSDLSIIEIRKLSNNISRSQYYVYLKMNVSLDDNNMVA